METTTSTITQTDSDRKIETDPPENPNPPPDFPPDSFWLSKDAEFDWMDQYAFYERKDSGKGSDPNPNKNPNSAASSQRFVKKSKASILGLPKVQKSSFADAKHRRNPANIRFFPKRVKSDVPMTEPSSPKVSCMGRVRSKRDKMKNRERASEPELEVKKPVRKGFWKGLGGIFRFGSGKKPVQKKKDSIKRGHVTEEEKSRDVLVNESEEPVVVVVEPPVLGGMMKFASGRRSDAWADDVTR